MTIDSEHIRDERREQIKKAALKVFAQHGLIGTKMSMIAKEAKISDGLSYRYFKSKDEILAELVESAVEGAKEAFALVGTMPGTPTDKIRMMAQEILQEDNHAFILMQQVMTARDVPDEVAKLMSDYDPLAMIVALAPIIKSGQENGEFIDGDPGELSMWYLSTLSGLMNIRSDNLEGYRRPTPDFMIRLLLK
ncbi:TetR/AcrR family transcriptional regulator [Paenibacillus sepulcri]|uniref:TetR/AcrR family transcriptional regulator n=1 Tax=Paenibacillus sepulcri TaxID=359917 RepID=A0ABS7CCL0_9BACL|nr:TetR/AcrR family transcriptional regulator [Paenibacillus sepulcri]